MLKNLIFLVITALCIQVSESGPWCYSCEKVFLPAICGLAQQCADSEICFTALHEGLNGGKQYRSGCTPASKCSKNVTRRAIEKRDNPETCNECCSGDFCNSKLCGGMVIIKPDQKHCMKCEAVQKTAECDQFELCGTDQQCFVKAVDHFNQNFFAMGCQDKSTCSKDNDLCCDTDMCNAGANVTVTTAAPTTSAATTKPTSVLSTTQQTTSLQSTPPVTTVQTTALPTTTVVTTMPTTKQATTTTPKPTTTATPTTTTEKPTTTTSKPTTTTSKPTTTTAKPTTTTPKPTTTTSKLTTTTAKPTTTTAKPTTTTMKPTTTTPKPTTTTVKPTPTVQTTTPIPTTTVTTTTLPTTLGVPPKISNVKPSVEVINHDNVTLVCDVTGSPKPTVSWNYDKRIFNARVIGNNLFIQHVTKVNEGAYECFAENNHGTAQETTNVTVKVPVKVKVDEPVVAIKPTDVTGIVRLKCTGSGDPKPVITWNKLNMPPIVTDSSHMVMSGGEIIIHGITPINKLEFTGVYECKGDNKVDTDKAYQIIAGFIPYSLSEENSFDKFGAQPGEAFQAYCAPGKGEPDGSPINKEFNLDDKICLAARKVGAIGKGAGNVTWMIKSNSHPEIIDQAKGKIEFT